MWLSTGPTSGDADKAVGGVLSINIEPVEEIDVDDIAFDNSGVDIVLDGIDEGAKCV